MRKLHSIFLITILMVSTLVLCQPALAVDTINIDTLAAAKVTYGSQVTISGAISTGPDQSVTIQRKPANVAGYTDMASTVSAGGGSFSFTFTPDRTAHYKVVQHSTGLESNVKLVTVAMKLGLISRPRKVWIGQRAVIKGQLSPSLYNRSVTLQRYTRKRWRTIARKKSNTKGVFKFTPTLGTAVNYVLRFRYGGETLYYKASSNKFIVKARWRNRFKISAKYKHYIVINKHNYKLYYLRYGLIKKSWPCGVGMPGYSTPSGNFKVTAKRYHPTWYNPGAPWSANMPSSIPWPASPLGERALNLSASGIRIHGTTKPWLLDNPNRAISHGCVRMKNPHVIWLYNRVPVGTRVKIF